MIAAKLLDEAELRTIQGEFHNTSGQDGTWIWKVQIDRTPPRWLSSEVFSRMQTITISVSAASDAIPPLVLTTVRYPETNL